MAYSVPHSNDIERNPQHGRLATHPQEVPLSFGEPTDPRLLALAAKRIAGDLHTDLDSTRELLMALGLDEDRGALLAGTWTNRADLLAGLFDRRSEVAA